MPLNWTGGFVTSVAKWKIQQYCTAAFRFSYFTKNDRTYEKNEKGPENYKMAKLCPAHHVSVRTWRLCPLNEAAAVCFTQTQSIKVHYMITPSVVTKAPNLHTVSVFYHWETHSEKWENYRTFGLFCHYWSYIVWGKIIVQIQLLSYIWKTLVLTDVPCSGIRQK